MSGKFSLQKKGGPRAAKKSAKGKRSRRSSAGRQRGIDPEHKDHRRKRQPAGGDEGCSTGKKRGDTRKL